MKTCVYAQKERACDATGNMTKSQSGKNFLKFWCSLSVGLPRGEGPGPAPAHVNVNTASGHAHAPETARGSHHGLTQVNDVPESERRSGRRKDCLPYDPRL